VGAEPTTLSRLAEVAARTQRVSTIGGDTVVEGVEHDSRLVLPGQAFIALRGETSDGHDYAASVVAAGAAALVVDHDVGVAVPQLVVEHTRPLMATIAAEVYGHPSRSLTVVGLTGTNGKTTVTYLLEAMGTAAGRTMGLIGTVGARIAGEPHPVGFTTPEATHLQRLLRTMHDAGVDTVTMEVSSHALQQGRADEVAFDVVAFTNLSQDHLDYHDTMETYYRAKRRLFEPGRARTAVISVDDAWGRRLVRETAIRVVTVGMAEDADLHGTILEATPTGTRLKVAGEAIDTVLPVHLAGGFNASNALVAVGCALEMGLPVDAVVAGIDAVRVVPGRFERVPSDHGFEVVVDYAHTPEAMATVISAVRPLTTGRVIAVGGAGGDRDRTKRPSMGAALATADLAIITSDNPRSEDPMAILDQVAAGAGDSDVIVEPDRRHAIRRALRAARPGDVVLVLGKGHESGQQIGNRILPFDDVAVAAAELTALAEDES
jgi:UDP-N-acetylmuramoyl-L-alanyl-D-glutamate--2,6-diaminopimelate ligase